jgi:type IV secretory pathway protease TraF
MRGDSMNKLAIMLGVITLVVALAAAPMPLAETPQNSTKSVVIFPNTLFVVPLILLGTLLLLYGATWKKNTSSK